MGRLPNYRRDQLKLRSWQALETKVRRTENMMVRRGKGKYPACLESRGFSFCPKAGTQTLDLVPKECRWCPNFLESKSHLIASSRDRAIRLQRAGVPTAVSIQSASEDED